MKDYHVTFHVTRMHQVQLSESAVATLHITRYRLNNEKKVTCGITAHGLPWDGYNTVNISVEPNWAVTQLLDWRKHGLKVSTFTIPMSAHQFSLKG